jgi:hypothetical protein
MNPGVIIVSVVSAFAAAVVPTTATFAATAPAPCEDMLNNVKAALKDAKLSDADKAKVSDLENQGLERCKADDDAGADDFFAQALKVMGK